MLFTQKGEGGRGDNEWGEEKGTRDLQRGWGRMEGLGGEGGHLVGPNCICPVLVEL